MLNISAFVLSNAFIEYAPFECLLTIVHTHYCLMHIFCLTSDLFRSGLVFHKKEVYNLDHYVHVTLIYDNAALFALNEVVM